jgi:hypothetical protein
MNVSSSQENLASTILKNNSLIQDPKEVVMKRPSNATQGEQISITSGAGVGVLI